MKILSVLIHNCKSIEDTQIIFDDYTLLVGANNSGKSNIINSIRLLLGDIKPTKSDIPLWIKEECDSWIEAKIEFSEEIQRIIGEGYFDGLICKIRRVVSSTDVKFKTGKLYAISVDGLEIKEIISGLMGEAIYIPAIANASDQMYLISGFRRSRPRTRVLLLSCGAWLGR
ncbi:AAA family ATPase [Deinococcus detaillensis]|uniref:AAA family ATPase n=1 Tax=Deinococcus detaillensis TaxID=2592048 RepID=UPI00163DD738|nr:ATP-binding protein [Deinococcus detaillensis]